MKKVTLIIIIILLLGFIGVEVCFIVNTNQKYSEKEEYEKYLYIKQTLSKGTITEEEENELNNGKEFEKIEIYKGKVIEYSGEIEDLKIKVKSVTEDEVKIKLNVGMSYAMNDDSLSQSSFYNKRTFTIKKGEKLRLQTNSMDVCDNYEIEYR